MDRTEQIDTFCRYTQVSRETIRSLVKYEEFLKEANKSFNLIGNSTINDIWHRHFLDSYQAIDFIGQLYTLSQKIEGKDIDRASEACLSINGLVSQIEMRLLRLKQEAKYFQE